MAGPVLEIVSGDLQGRKYRVEDERFVIGRAPSCDLVIPKRYISREHAEISRAGRDYVIDGLSEKNPVLLENRPLRPGHRLTDGDEFEVCGIKIRFLLAGDAGVKKEKGTVMSGSDSRQEEDEASWGPAPKAKARGAGAASPPSESDAPAARRSPGPPSDEDEDDIPRRRSPPSDSDVPVKAPANVKASAARSTPGKVVFGEFEPADEDEDEQTKAIGSKAQKKPPASEKGSQKGGSQKGSGSESHNERTAELGKVQDPNDPDYDPFAEVDSRKKGGKKKDPGREKALRILMVVGFLGIVLAAGLVYHITKPKPWVTVVHPTALTLAKGQTLRFEEQWSQIDPPDGRVATRRSGEPYIYWQDAVAEVEWAVPHVKAKCVFLVRGLEQGPSQFQLVFQESRRVKIFNILVDGDDPHEVARERRKAELAQKSPRELSQIARSHLDIGETLYKEREVVGREGNLRQAWFELRQASDAAITLHKLLSAQGTVPPDVMELVDKCDDAEERARNEYDEFVNREFARYVAALSRSAQLECVEQLRRTLRAINHDCDPRFQRLKLILEESFQVPWASDQTELCTER